MATRSVDVAGFRLTLDVPERVCRPIRGVVRRATRRSRAGTPDSVDGQLVVGDAPRVSYERRDPDAGVAFIRDRVEWRAANPRNGRDVDEGKSDGAAIARAVAGHPWYHTIELPHGVVTSGYFDHRPLVPLYGIPADLQGKRVLDVGTADGFWAFEFERRGAKVTAVDIETTAEVDLPRRVRRLAGAKGWADPLGDGFVLAHRVLQSRVEHVSGTVYELDPDRLGRFDLVHAGDLLLHLRDPMRALEQIRAVTAGEALLSDVFDPTLGSPTHEERQLVRYLGGWKTAGWWTPALGTLVQMVADAGFSRVDVITTYRLASRGMAEGPWRAVLRARP